MLSFLAGCELTDASYTLHMEAMAALLVCMSTQMFCELSSAAPQPLAAAVLRSEAGIARRVVARLLQHYMRRPAPPKDYAAPGATAPERARFRGVKRLEDRDSYRESFPKEEGGILSQAGFPQFGARKRFPFFR